MLCGTWHYPNKNLLEAEQEHWIFLLDIGDLVHVSIIFWRLYILHFFNWIWLYAVNEYKTRYGLQITLVVQVVFISQSLESFLVNYYNIITYIIPL